MDKVCCAYIMISRRNGTLYTEVSSDLKKRVKQHKQGFVEGFSKQHKTTTLVYFQVCDSMEAAIIREKQIKNGTVRGR